MDDTVGRGREWLHWRNDSAARHLDCVVAVLFRQDPPGCPGVKEQLVRDGILPAGWANTPVPPWG